MSTFQILIDRLKGGQNCRIEECVEAAFLGPDEAELKFGSKVQIRGEAYLTDDHLIVHLKAATKVQMPCSVCNQMIAVDLKVDSFYHTEPIQQIPSAVFDYSDALREALLIELPKVVECNEGNCPERATITPYLSSKVQTHCPFADIDKNLN